jgi:hypothetical protein
MQSKPGLTLIFCFLFPSFLFSQTAENMVVEGAIKINDTSNPNPEAGTIRWNPVAEDFEGYTGTQWKSLTNTGEKLWGNGTIMDYRGFENGKVTASDAAANDFFGNSVSISGDYAIVGAPFDNNSTGAAYVFSRSGNGWSEQTKLTASNAAAGDEFGISVAISGDYAIVGAHFKNSGTGAAYVFHRSGSTWPEQDILTASDGMQSDLFGFSTSITSNHVIVGAWNHNNTTGSAYVFNRSGNVWSEQAKLTASNAAAGDEFGYSVGLHGDYAVVGATQISNNGSGTAYVYQRTGNTWPEQDILTAAGLNAGDKFGISVDISGDYVIVGATGDDDDGMDAGAAFIFVRSGISWMEQIKLSGSGNSTGDQFGISVSISGDNATIGSHLDADDTNSGVVYVFNRTGIFWTQKARLVPSDAADDDRFGMSVSIDGGWIIVGAAEDDDDGDNSGSAYFFE